jgi:hypothetical protein
MCMFCRSLFVLLLFFFWSLCCLFFFDLRILIIPLVSSNSSYNCVSKADTLLDGNYPYHGKGGIAIVYKSNLIKIRLLLYRLFLISGDTLTFINIPFGFISGFIFQATNHRWGYFLKPSTHQELLSDWSIYVIVFQCMIGRPN